MKIEKVHIKNVKGIKDLELSFKKDDKILDLIVLAGVNGSGKTTILEAIKDFFDNRNIDFNDIEKSNIKSILTCLIIFTLTYILTREKK